jgi:tRNA threonylcarbamoyladenosine biosynthesis protein TsaB
MESTFADPCHRYGARSLRGLRGHRRQRRPARRRVDAARARPRRGASAADRAGHGPGRGRLRGTRPGRGYTGLRVGLSAARAIGLAAGIPVVGVTTLSALLAPQLALNGEDAVVAAIDARHGAVYLQAMSVTEGTVIPPRHVALEEAVGLRGGRRAILTGSGAPALAAAAGAAGLAVEVAETGAPQIAWVASLGLVADPDQALPRPLYLRGPDAQPQDHARLARA